MLFRVQDQTATAEEIELVVAMRAGDERAFMTVVERHHPAMLTLANAYVATPEAAGQVVQDGWMAALEERAGFDGGIPLRAWLLRFVARSAPPPAVEAEGGGARRSAAAADAERFRGRGEAFPGHWRAYPHDWRDLPDHVLRGDVARRVVQDAIDALPVEQRTVITVRDVLRCPPRDVCAVLDLSESAARERLHRARSQVRAALERHFDG
jgi:RNA polymerase sigma-70 factor (ECF subfamily)